MVRRHSKREVADPDRLSLEKKDILEFCDRVIDEWKKTHHDVNNVRNIAAMNAVRMAVFFTDDDSLKAIWKEIIKWVYQLLYENAIKQAKEENAKWASTFEKMKKRPSRHKH